MLSVHDQDPQPITLTKTDTVHRFFPTTTLHSLVVVAASVGLLTAVLGFSRSARKEEAIVPPHIERVTTSSKDLIERDTRLLAVTAAERLDTILDPLFANFHNRVPDFGEWAFGWRTGYRFLREGMLAAVSLPFRETPELEYVNSTWNRLITNKFNELVLDPVGGIPALHNAHEHWLAEMRPTVDMVMMDTVHTVALLYGRIPSLPQTETLPQEDTLAEETTLTEEQAALLTKVSAASSAIKLRAARPLLSRLTIRPPVAAAVTAAGTAIGNQTETWLGSISNLGAVIVAFLSIDYMLSQTDAGIHRPTLEADVHRVLDNEHQRLRKTWLAEQQATVDAQVEKIRSLLDIEKINSLPNSAPTHETPETALPPPDR
jgi:hypothetical protein